MRAVVTTQQGVPVLNWLMGIVRSCPHQVLCIGRPRAISCPELWSFFFFFFKPEHEALGPPVLPGL